MAVELTGCSQYGKSIEMAIEHDLVASRVCLNGNHSNVQYGDMANRAIGTHQRYFVAMFVYTSDRIAIKMAGCMGGMYVPYVCVQYAPPGYRAGWLPLYCTV